MEHTQVPGIQKKIGLLESSIAEITKYIKEYHQNILTASTPGRTETKPRETQKKITVHNDGRIIQADTAVSTIFGIENGLDSTPFSALLISEQREQFLQELQSCREGDELIKIGRHERGFEIPLRLRLHSRTDDQLTFHVHDSSGRRELETELEESLVNYNILAETATDAIVLIGIDFNIRFANSAVQQIFGYKNEELGNKSIKMLFPPSRSKNYEDQIKKYFFIDDTHRKVSGIQNTIELLGKTKDGELVPIEISFGNSMGVENNRVLTCIVRDIAMRKKAERRLKFLAYHDKLTSLGNRDSLTEAIDRLFAEIRREPERKAALMFLDLDGFKKVNDSLGHEMGDMILKETARRLSDCIRQGDNVYRVEMEDIFRLGGDEFTILLPRIKQAPDAGLVADRIIDKILEPYNIKGYGAISDISMGGSIGIALIPDDGEDRSAILRNADAAMYKAKELGNTYIFFTKEMNNKAMERLMLEEGIRKSLKKQDFELHYQPIVDEEGMVKGMEALLRWSHPEKGLIMPQDFISIAEDARLILPLGKWVLETAAKHIQYWKSFGFDHFYVSINISPKQLEKQNLEELVSKIAKKNNLDPKYIVLELTETSLMEDPMSAIDKINRVISSNEGIRFAIDDFGTGYSSLGYLSKFPVHNLKIDQSFVMNLYEEPNNIKIVNSILRLGKSLDLDIIAEGVETEEQFSFLSGRGCSSFQGYYFSKAMPVQEMTEYLRKHSK